MVGALRPRHPPDWRCHEHGFMERGREDDLYELRPCPILGADGTRYGLPLFMA